VTPTTIAVLPFTDVGGANGVGTGLAEALVHELSQASGLVVPALGTSLQQAATNKCPVAAASQLGAQAIMVGTIQVHERTVEVQARLRAVPSGRTLWDGSFTRPTSDLAALQQSLAHAVSHRLGKRLAPQGPSSASAIPAAQRAYQRGLYNQAQVGEESYRRAAGFYLQALELDPRFVQARLQLAWLTYQEGYYGFGEEKPLDRYRASARMVETILRDHPNHPMALDLMGVLQLADWKVPAAAASFRQALQLSPFDPGAHQHLAWALLTMGRKEEARDQMQVAASIDPSPLHSQTALAYLEYLCDNHREAVEQFRETLEIEPRFWRSHIGLARALTELGEYEGAEEHLRRAAEINGQARETIAAMGYLYGVSGRPALARATQKRLEELGTSPLQLAQVAAGLGEIDRGLALLEQGFVDRTLTPSDLVDPQLSPLRRHPQWRQLESLARGQRPLLGDIEQIFVTGRSLAGRW